MPRMGRKQMSKRWRQAGKGRRHRQPQHRRAIERCETTGKACYPHNIAEAVRVQASRRRNGHVFGIYRHPECGWWHVGHVTRN